MISAARSCEASQISHPIRSFAVERTATHILSLIEFFAQPLQWHEARLLFPAAGEPHLGCHNELPRAAG